MPLGMFYLWNNFQSFFRCVTDCSSYHLCGHLVSVDGAFYRTNILVSRAGLTIVPFMPWHRPPIVRDPHGHLLNFSYHITFYKYGSTRIWRLIGLFYQTAPVLKSTGHFFYKRGPLIQGHKIGCPRLELLLNFTLRYGYSLWHDVIFVDNIHSPRTACWFNTLASLPFTYFQMKHYYITTGNGLKMASTVAYNLWDNPAIRHRYSIVNFNYN